MCPLTMCFLDRSAPRKVVRGGSRKNFKPRRPDYQEDDTLDTDAWDSLEVSGGHFLACQQPGHAV